MEFQVFKELMKSRFEIKEKYTQDNIKLTNKKEKLWYVRDITQWDINNNVENTDYAKLVNDKQYAFSIMCSKETNALQSLYNQAGFVNQNTKDELKRIVARHCLLYKKHIKMFGNNFSPSINDALQIWTNLIDGIDIELAI